MTMPRTIRELADCLYDEHSDGDTRMQAMKELERMRDEIDRILEIFKEVVVRDG